MQFLEVFCSIFYRRVTLTEDTGGGGGACRMSGYLHRMPVALKIALNGAGRDVWMSNLFPFTAVLLENIPLLMHADRKSVV